MDMVILIMVIIVIMGLVFDFINGFYDIVNVVVISILIRVLKL